MPTPPPDLAVAAAKALPSVLALIVAMSLTPPAPQQTRPRNRAEKRAELKRLAR